MIRKSRVFSPITIFNSIETGQLSRLNQRSREQRDARVQTHAHAHVHRGRDNARRGDK